MANNEQARQVAPVTEEEVFLVCDALVAAGKDVTKRAVLQGVGRGSMTTIARLTAVWEERQRSRAEARDVELTEEESEQILTLGRQLLRSLTDRVRLEAAGREHELTELVERERQRAAGLAIDYDELSTETTAEIARLGGELAQARSDVADATTVLGDIQVQLQQVTGRAEAAEIRAAAAEERISAAATAAGEAKGRADALAGDLATARATVEKVTAALAEAEREAARQAAATTLAEERAKAAIEIAAERARSIAALEARIAALTAA